MVAKELLDYVRENLKKGYSADEIVKSALEAGWPSSEAEQAVKEATAAKAEKAEAPAEGLFEQLKKKPLLTVIAFIVVVALAAMALLFSIASFAPPVVKDFRIVVKDATSPVKNAFVEVFKEADNTTVLLANATTDELGVAVFEELPKGILVIRVSHEGYDPIEKKVDTNVQLSASLRFTTSKRICSPGVKQCLGSTLQECAADGTAWIDLQACGYGCKDNACLPAPACTPRSKRCSDSVLQACLDGVEWTDVMECEYGCEDNKCLQAPAPTPTPAPADNPPDVSLVYPANAAAVQAGNISFNFTPVDDRGFSSAALYGNFTGVWQVNASNQSAVANASINSIAVSLAPGYYVWNVLVCDNASTAQCRFAPSNYSLNASPSAVPCAGTNESCGSPGACVNCTSLNGNYTTCVGRNKTQEFRTHYCVGNSCNYTASNASVLEVCAYKCEFGECVAPPSNFSSWDNVTNNCVYVAGVYNCSAPNIEVIGAVVVPANESVVFDADRFELTKEGSIEGGGRVTIAARSVYLEGSISSKELVFIQVK